MRLNDVSEIVGKTGEEVFVGDNAWVYERGQHVEETGEGDIVLDAELIVPGPEEDSKPDKLSANLTILPLISPEDKKLGVMFMIEDISSEKRMKSTMSRYMDPGLADQLMAGGDDALGGQSITATVLFPMCARLRQLPSPWGRRAPLRC